MSFLPGTNIVFLNYNFRSVQEDAVLGIRKTIKIVKLIITKFLSILRSSATSSRIVLIIFTHTSRYVQETAENGKA